MRYLNRSDEQQIEEDDIGSELEFDIDSEADSDISLDQQPVTLEETIGISVIADIAPLINTDKVQKEACIEELAEYTEYHRKFIAANGGKELIELDHFKQSSIKQEAQRIEKILPKESRSVEENEQLSQYYASGNFNNFIASKRGMPRGTVIASLKGVRITEDEDLPLNLKNANLSESNLADTIFLLPIDSSVDLRNTDLRGAQLESTGGRNYDFDNKLQIDGAIIDDKTCIVSRGWIFNGTKSFKEVAKLRSKESTFNKANNLSYILDDVITVISATRGLNKEDLIEKITKQAIDKYLFLIEEAEQQGFTFLAESLVESARECKRDFNYLVNHASTINDLAILNEIRQKVLDNVKHVDIQQELPENNIIIATKDDMVKYAELHREYNKLSKSQRAAKKLEIEQIKRKNPDERSAEEILTLNLVAASGNFNQFMAAISGKGKGIVTIDSTTLKGTKDELIDLSEADFSFSNLSHLNLRHIDFTGAKFKRANLSQTRFENCDLTETDFSKSTIEDGVFEGNLMKGTNFRKTDLTGSIFGDTIAVANGNLKVEEQCYNDMTEVSFEQASMKNVSFVGNRVRKNAKLNFTGATFDDLSQFRAFVDVDNGNFVEIFNNSEREKFGLPEFAELPDQIRAEDREAVQICQRAGARVVGFFPGAAAGFYYGLALGPSGALVGAVTGGAVSAYTAGRGYNIASGQQPLNSNLGDALAVTGEATRIVAGEIVSAVTNPKILKKGLVVVATQAAIMSVAIVAPPLAPLVTIAASGVGIVGALAVGNDVYTEAAPRIRERLGEVNTSYQQDRRAFGMTLHQQVDTDRQIERTIGNRISKAYQFCKNMAQRLFPTKEKVAAAICIGLLVVGIGIASGGIGFAVTAITWGAVAAVAAYISYDDVKNGISKMWGGIKRLFGYNKKTSDGQQPEIAATMDAVVPVQQQPARDMQQRERRSHTQALAGNRERGREREREQPLPHSS